MSDRPTYSTVPHLRRRTLLAAGTVSAALTAVPMTARARPRDTRPHHSSRLSYPFTLGVASGDPSDDGVVLWTRLAPSPVDDDGMGGMPAHRSFQVQWQVADDPHMRRVIQSGVVETDPEWAHTVHLELQGLRPGREYYYRFRQGSHLSAVGRTCTAPDGMQSLKRIAVASCQAWLGGYYTAHRRLAEDHPDLVLFLGDYIYEQMSRIGRDIRQHLGPRPLSVASYRQRYAQYKSDPDLQASHAVAPWLVILDDHEIENGWAGDEQMPELVVPGIDFLRQRANAFKAFYEHMPLRRSARPRGPSMRLYRRIHWGRLATFYALDGRQYRSDITDTLAEAKDPSRTMIGDVQEAWLLNEMERSPAVWNLVLNDVMFAQRDKKLGEGVKFAFETWDGYAAGRQRLIDGLVARSVTNPIFFTGNQHRNFASNILADFDEPDSPVVGAEFVGTSITSGRDGQDQTPGGVRLEKENPWIKFGNLQRGFLRVDLSAEQLQVDFRVLPYVTRPGAPVSTRASYVVEAGRPGIEAVNS